MAFKGRIPFSYHLGALNDFIGEVKVTADSGNQWFTAAQLEEYAAATSVTVDANSTIDIPCVVHIISDRPSSDGINGMNGLYVQDYATRIFNTINFGGSVSPNMHNYTDHEGLNDLNINFVPATTDINGNPLNIPGLNLVHGDTLTRTVSWDGLTYTYTYPESGVAAHERNEWQGIDPDHADSEYHPDSSSTHIRNYGVPFQGIHISAIAELVTPDFPVRNYFNIYIVNKMLGIGYTGTSNILNSISQFTKATTIPSHVNIPTETNYEASDGEEWNCNSGTWDDCGQTSIWGAVNHYVKRSSSSDIIMDASKMVGATTIGGYNANDVRRMLGFHMIPVPPPYAQFMGNENIFGLFLSHNSLSAMGENHYGYEGDTYQTNVTDFFSRHKGITSASGNGHILTGVYTCLGIIPFNTIDFDYSSGTKFLSANCDGVNLTPSGCIYDTTDVGGDCVNDTWVMDTGWFTSDPSYIDCAGVSHINSSTNPQDSLNNYIGCVVGRGRYLTAGQKNKIRAHFLNDYTYIGEDGIEKYGIVRELAVGTPFTGTPPPPTPVPGCTDAAAINYNSLATEDDDSCIPFIYGCTNPVAFNYNSNANTDDGSCVAIVHGCMDPNYSEYNASANTDNGSCSTPWSADTLLLAANIIEYDSPCSVEFRNLNNRITAKARSRTLTIEEQQKIFKFNSIKKTINNLSETYN